MIDPKNLRALLRPLLTALALTMISLTPHQLMSQSTPQTGQEESDRITGASGGTPEVKYSLMSRHDPGVRHVYKYTEVTNVQRQYNDPDSTKLKYSRRMTYYLTMFMPDDPEDGRKTFYLNIDSMYFEFDNFQNEYIEYDSQKDEANLNHPELLAATVLMNRPVYMTYSPYGEVVGYESEELDFLRNYLNDGGDTVLPALDYFLWWDRMDQKNITQLLDIQRNLLPETYIYPDSSWQRDVAMRYDGINFSGAATMHIDKFDKGIYEIVGKSPALQLSPSQKVYMYGHPDFCFVDSGEAEAEYVVRFNRLGVLGSVDTKLKATIEVDSKPWSFTEHLTTDNKVELMGRWQW